MVLVHPSRSKTGVYLPVQPLTIAGKDDINLAHLKGYRGKIPEGALFLTFNPSLAILPGAAGSIPMFYLKLGVYIYIYVYMYIYILIKYIHIYIYMDHIFKKGNIKYTEDANLHSFLLFML